MHMRMSHELQDESNSDAVSVLHCYAEMSLIGMAYQTSSWSPVFRHEIGGTE